MRNPPHLGELNRVGMEEVAWNVTETAARLDCERGTLSRLHERKTGVSANMALEDIGWTTAEHWMRMKAGYEPARVQGKSGRPRADRRSLHLDGLLRHRPESDTIRRASQIRGQIP